jgi:hypothetical protein
MGEMWTEWSLYETWDRCFVCLADHLPLFAASDVRLSSGPKEYLGMLEYRREDEAKLIQNLILGSKTWSS